MSSLLDTGKHLRKSLGSWGLGAWLKGTGQGWAGLGMPCRPPQAFCGTAWWGTSVGPVAPHIPLGLMLGEGRAQSPSQCGQEVPAGNTQ